jgi:hypothetical protein
MPRTMKPLREERDEESAGRSARMQENKLVLEGEGGPDESKLSSDDLRRPFTRMAVKDLGNDPTRLETHDGD